METLYLTDPAKTGGCSTEDGSFIPFYPIVGEGDELK